LQEIHDVQVKIDAMVHAEAATGPSAEQSAEATSHHQPTLRAMAGVESKLGNLSPETMNAAIAAMERARVADRAG
jgi:hypothetical protein